MYTESKFDPNARSQADARGLAQFMPGTWKAYGPEGVSPFDPVASAEAQRVYMDVLHKEVTKLIDQGKIHGDARELTFAAYNAGIGNVRKYGGVPPFKETKDYIERINTQARIYGDAIQVEYVMGVASSQVQQ
jgi:soluble lytic murein transglycosylase-like protein